jgi:DNA-binding MarR family transcriptional regulator
MTIEAVKLDEHGDAVFHQSRVTEPRIAADPPPRTGEKSPKATVQHLDLARYVERAHRRYLDLLRAEMTRLGIDDVSPAQVLMMFTIGEGELSVRDLLERGNYLGSNASYNLKRLWEAGYIVRESSSRDRRSAYISLTAKGHSLCETIRAVDRSYQDLLVRNADEQRDLETTISTLRRVEIMFITAMRYGDITRPGDAST